MFDMLEVVLVCCNFGIVYKKLVLITSVKALF